MPGKALIVEDDDSLATLIALVLREASIASVIAPSAARGRELARTERPDLVLVDVNLPDGQGTSLISYLRKLDDSVEIIVMTADRSFALVLDSIRDGAADFLEKPFTEGSLRAAVYRALKRRSARAIPLDPPLRATALLIDKDVRILRQLANDLAEVDVTPIQAVNIDEARRYLATHLPDVVIADVSEGGGEVIEFLRELKQAHPETQIVALTTSTTTAIAISALRVGAIDIVLKPADRQEFQRAVLEARRIRMASEERRSMKRQLDAYKSGLEHLQQVLEKKAMERAPASSHGDDLPWRILQSLSSGIVVIDSGLKVTKLNAAAERILSTADKVVVGQSMDDIAQLAPFRYAILQNLHTGQAFMNLEGEVPIGGATRVMGYGVVRLIGESFGDAAVVIFQDITHKKRLESYLRQTDRLASLGMMAAGISHEVSQPLNVALGTLHLVMKEAHDSAKFRDHIVKVHGSIKKAGEMLGRLTSMAFGSERDTAKTVDVHLAIRDACEVLDRKLQLGSHSVSLTLNASSPEVTGVSSEFKLVFINLLLFLCENNPGGGTITIRTVNLDDDLEILMQDSGPGISSSLLPHLLETPATDARGSSLRLPLCKSIVVRHCGTLTVASEIGSGTSFTLRFPITGLAATAALRG
jgi:DNA-binding response OmpR family regulator/nitrogen-specific signal transduction histidine kinase